MSDIKRAPLRMALANELYDLLKSLPGCQELDNEQVFEVADFAVLAMEKRVIRSWLDAIGLTPESLTHIVRYGALLTSDEQQIVRWADAIREVSS